ncbi:DUF3397 domain-containing protein [Caldibacillus lycopersici]|uniref:DUF3397 domain-containing protein n=1 Tax=Perspicuibacillus lycopersici TaxID=1325689 RepID=A0AAE3LRY3_9BACI|nr:DUF3397 domain-containing protein [Perspicuibacillus lycopersici]MCU9612208.1 DUF3397 domain-containing protein [Perspicuibacillus lycopersici]
MASFLSSILAIFIIAPVLLFVIIFFLSKYWIHDTRRSIQISADSTTLFFILSVHFIILAVWEKSLLSLLILLLLLTALCFAYLYWKLKGELNYGKIFRGFWRFSFLLYFTLYVFLIIFGVFSSAFTFLT